MTFSIMPFSKYTHTYLTLDINECHYAECHYPECHYPECRYPECHYPECRYPECRYPECRYPECHYPDCHYPECQGVLYDDLWLIYMPDFRIQFHIKLAHLESTIFFLFFKGASLMRKQTYVERFHKVPFTRESDFALASAFV